MLWGCCDEQVERRKAAQTGLNKTDATIMDMSANEPLTALNRLCHACRRSGLSGLLIALSLAVAGCTVRQPGPTARLIPPPRANTKSAREQAAAPEPPPAPSKPVQPVPRSSQSVTEIKPLPAPISQTRPAPATASKGAEKLVASNTPMVVRVSKRTTLPTGTSAPIAPTAEVSATVADAPLQALIFRGPPPQARTSRAGIKWLVWFGLGLGGAALAFAVRVWVVRRAESASPADAKEDELKMPAELLFKDSLNLPQEAVAAENP